jgi:hypothetical protein
MLVTLEVQHEPASGRYSATFSSERLRVSGVPFSEVQGPGLLRHDDGAPG